MFIEFLIDTACTAEHFFRIDRAQEHLHYICDIAVDELYILDQDEGSAALGLQKSSQITESVESFATLDYLPKHNLVIQEGEQKREVDVNNLEEGQQREENDEQEAEATSTTDTGQ